MTEHTPGPWKTETGEWAGIRLQRWRGCYCAGLVTKWLHNQCGHPYTERQRPPNRRRARPVGGAGVRIGGDE